MFGACTLIAQIGIKNGSHSKGNTALGVSFDWWAFGLNINLEHLFNNLMFLVLDDPRLTDK